MRPRFLFLHPADGVGAGIGEAGGALHDLLPVERRVGAATLFTSPGCPVIPLPAIEGCLIGSLFSANGSTALEGLSPAEQLTIMSTNGHALISQGSGAYVAMWRGCGDGPINVVRDPSACLPAFLVQGDGLLAIASDIECLTAANVAKLDIDPGGVAQHLRFPLVPNTATCLDGIEELRPGFRYELADRLNVDCLWHPRTFAASPSLDIDRIAAAIDAVATGQSIDGARCAIELSGGLDSSILAAAFAKATTPVALHMVPAAADGDERRYAHIVADHFNMPMHETPIGFEDVDPLAPAYRLTARPTGVLHFRPIDRKFRRAQAETGADLVFSGTGGDSVFGTLSSTAPVIDAWLDGGVRLARSTLADIARIRGVTRWEATRSLLRRLLVHRRRGWTWPADDSLLGPIGRAAVAPDGSLLDGLRPGARAYCASLLRMRALLDAHDRVVDGDIRFPLMAQPVLEACLAVPSWRWMTGGRDRAAAREAFAGRVPQEILQRRGKGRYDTLIVRAYEASKPGLRELLLDGWLARRGLIERDAVERALSTQTNNIEATYSRVIMLADTESWCRMILGRKRETGPR